MVRDSRLGCVDSRLESRDDFVRFIRTEDGRASYDDVAPCHECSIKTLLRRCRDNK
jgi:hypothetical protein